MPRYPTRNGALEIVGQMISDALVERSAPDGLDEDDIDRIFNSQPVYFDSFGYVPHWFSKDNIRRWGTQMRRSWHLIK